MLPGRRSRDWHSGPRFLGLLGGCRSEYCAAMAAMAANYAIHGHSHETMKLALKKLPHKPQITFLGHGPSCKVHARSTTTLTPPLHARGSQPLPPQASVAVVRVLRAPISQATADLLPAAPAHHAPRLRLIHLSRARQKRGTRWRHTHQVDKAVWLQALVVSTQSWPLGPHPYMSFHLHSHSLLHVWPFNTLSEVLTGALPYLFHHPSPTSER